LDELVNLLSMERGKSLEVPDFPISSNSNFSYIRDLQKNEEFSQDFFSLPSVDVLSEAIHNVDAESKGNIIIIEDYILTESTAVKLHLIHDLLYVKAKFRYEMLWLSKFEFISPFESLSVSGIIDQVEEYLRLLPVKISSTLLASDVVRLCCCRELSDVIIEEILIILMETKRISHRILLPSAFKKGIRFEDQEFLAPLFVNRNHWVLVHFDLSKVTIFDSLGKKNSYEEEIKDLGVGSFPKEFGSIPQQKDVSSCGVFMLVKAWELTERFKWDERHIDFFRAFFLTLIQTKYPLE